MSTDVAVAKRFARARAARIREGIHNYLETLSTIADAWRENDWRTLGYESWAAYVDGEFGADRLRLPVEHRQKAIEELRLAGMSQRAIASAVGVARNTVAADLASSQVAQSEPPGRVTGTDGKTYPTTRQPAAPTEAVADPPPAPPLVAAMRTAIEETTERVTERIQERPPAWDPEERRRHEEEVRRIRDIEAARRAAQNILTDVRSLVVTIVSGSRLGEPGLVTHQMVNELRDVLALLEKELADEGD